MKKRKYTRKTKTTKTTTKRTYTKRAQTLTPSDLAEVVFGAWLAASLAAKTGRVLNPRLTQR